MGGFGREGGGGVARGEVECDPIETHPDRPVEVVVAACLGSGAWQEVWVGVLDCKEGNAPNVT